VLGIFIFSVWHNPWTLFHRNAHVFLITHPFKFVDMLLTVLYVVCSRNFGWLFGWSVCTLCIYFVDVGSDPWVCLGLGVDEPAPFQPLVTSKHLIIIIHVSHVVWPVHIL